MVAFPLTPSIASAFVGAAPPVDDVHRVCGADPSNSCSFVMRHTRVEVLAKIADFAANRLLAIVIIWVVAWIINWIVRRVIRRVVADISGSVRSGKLSRLQGRRGRGSETASAMAASRSAARAETTGTVLRSGASIVIYGFAAIYTASALGVQLGPLLAGAGVLGVALGFGAQHIVADFLSGILLLIEDQFGVGDIVEIQSTTAGSVVTAGTIEAISLRTTRLRDVAGTVIYIPNGEIRRVGNMSQLPGRAVMDVTVPFDARVHDVERMVLSAAADVKADPDLGPDIIDEPDLWGVQEVGPNGLVIRMVLETRAGAQWRVARALRARLHEVLTDAGVRYGRPEQLVWVHPAGPAEPTSGDAG